MDADGNEVTAPGRHDKVDVPQFGWVRLGDYCKDGEKRRFYNLQTGASFEFPYTDIRYWCYRVLPGDVLIYNDVRGKNLDGVWSMREDKPVLPLSYYVYHHFTEDDTYAVNFRGRLQIRGSGDRLVKDFGPLNEARLLAGMGDGTPPLLIVRENDKKYCRRYHCVDCRTGETCSPVFLHIGGLYEGMRYMMTTDGRHCFVDAQWNEVFQLPVKPEADLLEDLQECGYIGDWEMRYQGGMVGVEDDDGYTWLLDKAGNVVTKRKNCRYVGEGRLLLKKGRLWALADTESSLLTDYDFYLNTDYYFFPSARFSSGSLILAKRLEKKKDRLGAVDVDGKEVIPFEYIGLKAWQDNAFCGGYVKATIDVGNTKR